MNCLRVYFVIREEAELYVSVDWKEPAERTAAEGGRLQLSWPGCLWGDGLLAEGVLLL